MRSIARVLACAAIMLAVSGCGDDDGTPASIDAAARMDASATTGDSGSASGDAGGASVDSGAPGADGALVELDAGVTDLDSGGRRRDGAIIGLRDGGRVDASISVRGDGGFFCRNDDDCEPMGLTCCEATGECISRICVLCCP